MTFEALGHFQPFLFIPRRVLLKQRKMTILTAPLRYELADGHTYEFVEAVLPCNPSPGRSCLLV